MARSFNGTTDNLQFSGAPVTAAPLTMACWFFPGNTVLSEEVVISDGTSSSYFALQTASSKVRASANAGGTAANASTSTTFAAGGWHHAAVVFASATSRSAYLDGGGKGTNATSRVPTGLNTTQVGTGPLADFFNGNLAEVCIWNVALTDAEIAALATGIRPNRVRPGNVVAYWPLFGLNSPDVDYSGNKQNLTVTGTTLANHSPVTLWTPKNIGAPLIGVATAGYIGRRTFVGFGARVGSRRVA